MFEVFQQVTLITFSGKEERGREMGSVGQIEGTPVVTRNSLNENDDL